MGSSDPTIAAGQPLPASILQEFGLLGSWTPTLTASVTNPTLGAGATSTGTWHRNAKLVTCSFKIMFGASGVSAGSGTYRISNLPFNLDLSVNTIMGNILVGDASSGKNYAVVPLSNTVSSTSLDLLTNVDGAGAGSIEAGGLIDDGSPVTWAAGDSFQGMFAYISA
jgi:hypothetical protein